MDDKPSIGADVTQHRGLTLERWRRFEPSQQILMIGNEMNRAGNQDEPEALRRSYERVLRLTDLTAQAAERPALRREILRWRDGIAELYLAERPDHERHRLLFKHLLLMTKESARQREHVLS